MNITISSTCEDVTLESEYLSGDNQSVVVTVQINCDEEYIIEGVTVDDTEIVITQDSLDLTGDTLEDGIYYFKIVVVQEDGTEVTESKCAFINCGVNCLLLDTFKAIGTDTDATTRALLFFALQAAQDCTDCACADLCYLYNLITEENCTSSNVSSPCGCS